MRSYPPTGPYNQHRQITLRWCAQRKPASVLGSYVSKWLVTPQGCGILKAAIQSFVIPNMRFCPSVSVTPQRLLTLLYCPHVEPWIWGMGWHIQTRVARRGKKCAWFYWFKDCPLIAFWTIALTFTLENYFYWLPKMQPRSSFSQCTNGKT